MSTPPTPAPRLQLPQRHQMAVELRSLDQMLPPDHDARTVWDNVAGLDLSAFLGAIQSVAGRPGHPAIDPRILLSLWLHATPNGVGSARELDRLTGEHLAYQWICGPGPVNDHTLADVRSDHATFLDDRLTQSVATRMHQGLVDLEEVAQDGLRVRASAGAKSFRREKSLQECLEHATAQVAARRERAARERRERIAEALRQPSAERHAQDAKDKGVKRKSEPRASTTDPDARVMKMPDGGTRPGYNVELATDTASGIVVGVDAANSGSDSGQMRPTVEQIHARYAKAPPRVLVDGGFATRADVEALHAEHEVAAYAPVKNAAAEQAKGKDPYQPKPTDGPGVAAWRTRMGTAEAQTIYKRRAQTAEWANARVRNWGLYRVRVRGVETVRAVAVLFALAHTLRQTLVLRARPATP